MSSPVTFAEQLVAFEEYSRSALGADPPVMGKQLYRLGMYPEITPSNARVAYSLAQRHLAASLIALERRWMKLPEKLRREIALEVAVLRFLRLVSLLEDAVDEIERSLSPPALRREHADPEDQENDEYQGSGGSHERLRSEKVRGAV